LITDIGDASVEMLLASFGKSITVHDFAESSVKNNLFNAQSKIYPLAGDNKNTAPMSEIP